MIELLVRLRLLEVGKILLILLLLIKREEVLILLLILRLKEPEEVPIPI